MFNVTTKTAAKASLWLLGGLGVLSYVSMLKVAAVAINLGAFLLLADVFYALSRRVLRDEYLAYKVKIWMDGPIRSGTFLLCRAIPGSEKTLARML